MKKNFQIIALFLAVIVMTLISCESNTPSQGNVRNRDYSFITFTNTTSKYCAVIYIDGVSLNEISDGLAWDGEWPLWAEKSNRLKLYDIKFPKDVKV